MILISKTTPILLLIKTYPTLQAALHDAGFVDIIKPGMLITVGRFMTLEKGMSLKKIPQEAVKAALNAHGFTLID